jgi:hypothetical protein
MSNSTLTAFTTAIKQKIEAANTGLIDTAVTALSKFYENQIKELQNIIT